MTKRNDHRNTTNKYDRKHEKSQKHNREIAGSAHGDHLIIANRRTKIPAIFRRLFGILHGV